MAGPPAADGRRVVEVFSRAGDDGDGPWTRHAAGTLAPETPAPAAAPADLATWPPQGAEPVDVTRLYQDLAAGGYGYGPAFQGLRAAWRRGSEVFAEVTAPADTVDPAGYGVHPALLDAVLHAAGLAAADGAKDAGVLLPFSWQGVTVHAAGATVLRARLTRAGDSPVADRSRRRRRPRHHRRVTRTAPGPGRADRGSPQRGRGRTVQRGMGPGSRPRFPAGKRPSRGWRSWARPGPPPGPDALRPTRTWPRWPPGSAAGRPRSRTWCWAGSRAPVIPPR